MSELIFIPPNTGLTRYHRGRLKKLGYEVFEVENPQDIIVGLPVGNMVKSGDIVATALIVAMRNTVGGSAEFGKHLLNLLYKEATNKDDEQ